MNFWNFLNMRYCIVHVAIIIFWIIKILSFDLSHLYIHKHTCSRAHTHTHTRMHTYRHIHTRMHIQKSTVLMKTSDLIKIEIERNKTKIFPLPKQNDWKCKMKKFIFSEVFQRFCLDFKWLHSSFGIQWPPFTDTSHSEAAIWNFGKILKN